MFDRYVFGGSKGHILTDTVLGSLGLYQNCVENIHSFVNFDSKNKHVGFMFFGSHDITDADEVLVWEIW